MRAGISIAASLRIVYCCVELRLVQVVGVLTAPLWRMCRRGVFLVGFWPIPIPPPHKREIVTVS